MLTLENIKKIYNPGSVTEMCVFDGFNLTVRTGEFVSIVGSNGSGKTSLMIKRAEEVLKNSDGTVVFIDSSDSLNYILPKGVRLINAKDFGIHGAKTLYGFISGLCAGNYDITDIFIDTTLKIIWNKTTDMDDFTSLLFELSKTTGVNFHIAYCDNYSPELVHENY